MYPIMLDLRGRPCLIVGGGGVALRKASGLLAESAEITVVTDRPCSGMIDLADADQIKLDRRPYASGEAADYVLVFAATDNRKVNREVFEDARAAGVWANVADDPELCSFHLPARVQRGNFQIALASAGHAPFAIRRMRELFEQRFGHEWNEWAEAAARFRRAVRNAGLSRVRQEAVYDDFFAATVDPNELVARVPSLEEETAWLRDATGASAEATPTGHSVALTRIDSDPGFVSLVGAGPGDAGLLTVRGAQRLRSCEAVVFDRLAATVLPCDLAPTVELHCVGKLPGRHPIPQEEINALLVRLAREGKRVVRLKGGDPYVFGRGGEEAEALAAAEIPFEIIPAVTAGLGIPAYAGIPVTRREESAHVTLVTAHECKSEAGPHVRWDKLAALENGTLVGYMGVTSLPSVVEQLLAAGMEPMMPAAMVERGTTSRQRVVTGPLAELPAIAEREQIEPPALFIIGTTVRHAGELDWFGKRLLFGERLGVVGAPADVIAALERQGAEVVRVTLPLTPAARLVIAASPLTGWVVGGADAVVALEEERGTPGWTTDTVTWCLSSTAATEARVLGWPQVVQVDGGMADTLVDAIAVRRVEKRRLRIVAV